MRNDNLEMIEGILVKGKAAAAEHNTDERVARNLQVTANLLLQKQNSWILTAPADSRNELYQFNADCFGIDAFTTGNGDIVGVFPYPFRRGYMRFSGLRPTEFYVLEKHIDRGIVGKKYVHLILIAPNESKPYVADFGFERFDLKQQIDSVCRLTLEEDTANKTSFYSTVVFTNAMQPKLLVLCSKRLYIDIDENFVRSLMERDTTQQ